MRFVCLGVKPVTESIELFLMILFLKLDMQVEIKAEK